MRIGVVDLDTSHPKGWIPIERELGHEVVGVWDSGDVHPPGYAQTFAESNGVPRVYESLEAMAQEVDCAVIHGCDWDTHIERARPFIASGKSVFLDKPLAGCLKDLEQICAWDAQGARIAGGSSLRFCYDTQAYLKRPVAERGTPHTIICGCTSTDELINYAIHGISLLSGLMGPGMHSVQHLGRKVQHRVRVNWADGRMGILVVGPSTKGIPFHVTSITELGVTHFMVDTSQLYRPLLETTLPYLARETDQPPMAIRDLIEPELCAVALMKSRMNGDSEVRLSDLREEDPGYDGKAFTEAYRLRKHPTYGTAARAKERKNGV